MKTIKIIILACFLFAGNACHKDSSQDDIPYAYINLVIKPNSTAYLELNVVGGYMYLDAPAPSRGLLVYRKSLDEFMAYERTCPYDPSKPCARIQTENTFTTAIDSCCGSRYLIQDGSPFSGPTREALRQYRTSYDGVNLYIYN